MTKLLATILSVVAMITDWVQLLVLRKKIVGGNGVDVCHYAVEVADGNGKIRVVPMAENPGTIQFAIEKKVRVLDGKEVRTIVKRDRYPFTKTVVSVAFKHLRLAGPFLRNGIFIKFNGARTRVMLRDGDKFIDLLARLPFEKSMVINEDGSLKQGIRHYRYWGQSKSMERKKQCLFVDVTPGEGAALSLLDRLTCGAASLMLGMEVEFSKGVKLWSRLFQWTASQKSIGPVGNFGIYRGKLLDEAGDNPIDGWNPVRAEYLRKRLGEHLGVKIAYKAIVGCGVQCRPFTAKIISPAVTDRYMRGLLKNIGEENTVVLQRDKLDRKLVKRLWSDEFEGKLVLIQDEPGLPNIIMDMDGCKAPFDMSRDWSFMLLDVPKPGRLYTSLQLLQKLVIAPDKLKQLVVELTADMLEERFGWLEDGRPKVPSLKDVKQGYLVDVIGKLAPKYLATKDRQMLVATLRNVVAGTMRDANMFRLPIKGCHLAVVVCPCTVLGMVSPLSIRDIYAPAINEGFWKMKTPKEERVFVAFKYPTMGIFEYLKGTAMSQKEVKQRIRELNPDAPKWKIDMAIDFYSNVKSGLVIISPNSKLKKLLAGLDSDGDKLAISIDKRFNSCFDGEEALRIINILDDPKEKSSKKYGLGLLGAAEIFLKQLMSPNKGIGTITHINDLIISLMSVVDEDPEKVKRGLRLILGEKKQGELKLLAGDPFNASVAAESVVYSPLPVRETDEGFVIDINHELSMKVINSAREALRGDVSKETLKQILYDLNTCGRRFQEKTIDAAGSGETIEYPLRAGIASTAHSWYDLDANWGEGSVIPVLREDDSQFERPELTVDCILGRMKRHIVNEIAKRVHDIANKLPDFSEEEKDFFAQAAVHVGGDVMRSTELLKYMYNSLSANFSGEIEQIKESVHMDPEEIEVSMKQLRAKYKENISELANLVRWVTEDLDPEMRARVLKHESLTNNGKDRGDGGSWFASSVCPEEYLLFVSRHWGELNFAGAEIINKGYKEGDAVSFYGGIAEKAVSVEEDIDGEFIIKEYKGRWYATRNLEEIVQVPEVDKSRVLFSVHPAESRNYKQVISALDRAKRIRLTANPKERDRVFITKEDGSTVSFRLRAEGGACNKVYDGVIGELEKIIYCPTKKESGEVVNYVLAVLKVLDRKPSGIRYMEKTEAEVKATASAIFKEAKAAAASVAAD